MSKEALTANGHAVYKGDKIIAVCAEECNWYKNGQTLTVRGQPFIDYEDHTWCVHVQEELSDGSYVELGHFDLVEEESLVLEEHPLESYPNKGYELKGSPAKDALTVQVGGGHYKGFKIQPVEYIYANNIPFLEGNVIKYTSRHRDKNRAVDIKKAIHCLELILKLEYPDEV